MKSEGFAGRVNGQTFSIYIYIVAENESVSARKRESAQPRQYPFNSTSIKFSIAATYFYKFGFTTHIKIES